MNYQAGRRLGVNLYLIDGGSEWILIDIGYLDAVDEIIDLIRKMDFSLAACKMIVATHADADHIQGLARARELLKTQVVAHPLSVEPMETGDEIMTYATIKPAITRSEPPQSVCFLFVSNQAQSLCESGNCATSESI